MSIRTKPRRLAAALGCAALLASAGAQAVPVSAWELSSVSASRTDSWAFGDLFTVGSSNITVSTLGALDVGLNGFVSKGGIAVGLYRESDHALLASTSVTSGNALVGNYRFADIADIQLLANTAYRVVAVNADDEYNGGLGVPTLVDPRISWNGYDYCTATALTFCNNQTGDDSTWLGNFQLDAPVGGGGTVPEPSSLALAGLGLLGLVARRHWGRQA
jgi:hypothetical protein